MPHSDPAERVVDRREPDGAAQTALEFRLELDQRDIPVCP
jgi:hypothetical protein